MCAVLRHLRGITLLPFMQADDICELSRKNKRINLRHPFLPYCVFNDTLWTSPGGMWLPCRSGLQIAGFHGLQLVNVTAV